MTTVNVSETFVSIQGESSYAGLSCFFIRLAGCNLRCRYCDTPSAYRPGTDVPIDELVAACTASGTAIAEITGGEPLHQPGFRALALALRRRLQGPVLVETNGSLDVSVVPDGVVAIVDVKCPGSGEAGSFDPANLSRLRRDDEVKFVLSDRADYDWAKAFVLEHEPAMRGRKAIFSPVWGTLKGGDLAQWILEDRLPVRLQVQLHKVLNVK